MKSLKLSCNNAQAFVRTYNRRIPVQMLVRWWNSVSTIFWEFFFFWELPARPRPTSFSVGVVRAGSTKINNTFRLQTVVFGHHKKYFKRAQVTHNFLRTQKLASAESECGKKLNDLQCTFKNKMLCTRIIIFPLG